MGAAQGGLERIQTRTSRARPKSHQPRLRHRPQNAYRTKVCGLTALLHISGVQNMEGVDGTGAVPRAGGFCAADDDCNNRERLVAWLRTWRITSREML